MAETGSIGIFSRVGVTTNTRRAGRKAMAQGELTVAIDESILRQPAELAAI